MAASNYEKRDASNWSSYIGLISNRTDSNIIALLEKSNKEDLVKYLVRDEDFAEVEVFFNNNQRNNPMW